MADVKRLTNRATQPEAGMPLLMVTELFLPTKGGTAVSFDDDFRRLGGKEVHIVTADVPGALEFDRTHPNTIHRLDLKRVPWLKPESLLMYAKLFLTSAALRRTASLPGDLRRARAAGRPRGLGDRPPHRQASADLRPRRGADGWGRGRKFKTSCFVASACRRHPVEQRLHARYARQPAGRRPWADQWWSIPTVDEERFRPGLPADDLRSSIWAGPGQHLVLSVGRLMRRKGFDNVIRALPMLRARGIDAHYAVIGIGDDRDYLSAWRRSSGWPTASTCSGT